MVQKTEIKALIEGGKASASPPLGPQLGPTGVKIPDVVAKINEKTKDLKGMQVPVTIIVNEDKSFEIRVGTPPTSALIKKELGIEKGSAEAGKLRVGDLSKEQVKKVAEAKFSSTVEGNLKQVEGTARSMGISVGKGDVTEEEVQAYEEAKKAEEAEKAPAATEDAAKAGETSKEGEAPKAAKEGEAPKEEKKEGKKGK
ncbi:MAG: ribosomal L11p family protein [Candidatus Aenigmarchaeota archaeon]|nr:ribosomal L11p family protein [Candidatus Aenigmarchaeota archaeon]